LAQVETVRRFDRQVTMTRTVLDPRVVDRITQWISSGSGSVQHARDARIFFARRGGASAAGVGTGYVPAAVYVETPVGICIIDARGGMCSLQEAYYDSEYRPEGAFNNVIPLDPDETPGDFEICMRVVAENPRYVGGMSSPVLSADMGWAPGRTQQQLDPSSLSGGAVEPFEPP